MGLRRPLGLAGGEHVPFDVRRLRQLETRLAVQAKKMFPLDALAKHAAVPPEVVVGRLPQN